MFSLVKSCVKMKLIKKVEVAKGEISRDRRDVDGGQRLLEHNKLCFFIHLPH